MRNADKADYRVGVGASSILMILVVLAMAALGLLALGSARNTEILTQRNVRMTEAYYSLAAQTQNTLAEIDEAVLTARVTGAAFGVETFKALHIDHVEWYEADDALYFDVLITDEYERGLCARGRVYSEGERRVELVEHRLISTKEAEEPDIQLMGE